MLLNPKRKEGGLTIAIVGHPKEKDDASYQEMLEGASEEILSAITSKDAKAFTLGLKNFLSICEEYGDMDSEEDMEVGEKDGEEEKTSY